MNWEKLDLVIYDTELYVGFARSHKELYKIAAKDGAEFTPEDKDTDMDGLFYYNKNDLKRILFVLPTSNRLIVHETFHATMHILDDIGQFFDLQNHEVHAWLQDYLFTEICKLRDLT
jgi:hypothetical protein